jgi:DMSO/TMAO reductase YedYZ molybdopterin-dependent catalytic subunit
MQRSFRRNFLQTFAGALLALGGLCNPLLFFVKRVWAETKKRTLSKGTDPSSLRNLSPKNLDTHNLEVMPLKDFGTMGDTDISVDTHKWRLKIDGQIEKPTSLTYAQIVKLPSFERNVLLICPGVFSNHGRWKGVSAKALLEMVKVKSEAEQVVFEGRAQFGEQKVEFPIEDFKSEQVFLCYEVNGKPLPQKHGFPLRVIAEGYDGSTWAKYITRIVFVDGNDEKNDLSFFTGS